MDSEEDMLSQLMLMDEGGKKFVADCLLLLSPEEIKCCRLVCTQWDQFIKGEDFWKSKRVKKELGQKLVQRWKTADPLKEQVAETREEIESIHCNDAYVFCGRENKVRVYDFASGQLIRELIPSQPGSPLYNDSTFRYSTSQVVGGKGIVAAVMRQERFAVLLTIWSSRGQMNQLCCFNFQNYHCPNDCNDPMDNDILQIRTVTVVGTEKVAILAQHRYSGIASLVLLEKGNDTWDTKTLGCFPLDFPWPSVASDGNWLTVLDYAHEKVKLWREDENVQDIVFPGLDGFKVIPCCIFLELPHLILGVTQYEDRGPVADWINVYRMEDTVPCLIKSINLEMGKDLFRYLEPIANQFCLGFVEVGFVWLFVKKELVNAELSPAKTEKREIRFKGYTMSMNTTCFVAGVGARENFWARRRHERRDNIEKTDFWMSKMGPTYPPL